MGQVKEYLILKGKADKIRAAMAELMEYIKNTKDTESQLFRDRTKLYKEKKVELAQVETDMLRMKTEPSFGR